MEEKEQEMHENLERGLKNRHIQLIGLGGAIGVGLFLGSATAIELAGPSVLLTYVIGGIAIYFIMRALGELSVAYPVSGAFSAHAARFLGPKWGYLTGWTYWYMWMVTCMAELTAGIHDHDECHQGAGKAIREETAVLPKVCDAGRDAAIADTEDNHADAADDHENNGADLHEGKPEFKLTIGRDSDEIHHGHDGKRDER